MSEYIGARISLISKSDIRYVGTLHEISSENSTVALENVTSFGTEGRKANPAEEIAPSDSIYEYIVFRGSDVKDLRIEEPAKETKPPPPPQVPNDPAILGSARPQSQNTGNQQRPQQPPNIPQQPPFPPYGQYPPPFQGQRFGPPGGPPGGFPGGPGGPGAPNAFPPYPGPYGAPPGWYPPPGQGFPNQPPGPFSPPQGPIGPPNQQTPSAPKAAVPTEKQELSADQPKPSTANDARPASKTVTPIPAGPAAKGPPPPMESKPPVAAALAPSGAGTPPKLAPTGPKAGRIVPAVPLPGAGNVGAQAAAPKAAAPTPLASAQQYENATHAATAAVAAAMAKLPPMPGQPKHGVPAPVNDSVENLTRKVQEMRTDDRIRRGNAQGTGGYATGQRGGRGGRGGRGSGREFGHGQRPKVEVPEEDYDFESANKKFNKQDLVKEAIASGSPLASPSEGASALNGHFQEHADTNGSGENKADDVTIPPASAPVYNKSTSFFDNLSSELRDREDAVNTGAKLGGREFRTEERKKNLETFGQGSVDGYRGGYRGRGRGRGYGRGGGRGYGRGRGGMRGRGGAGTTEATSG
ncbi:hypothetical protein NA57DRAFT_77724 [Rhizodiscina lignyota]|uniref:Uncharacterized protein n=1 Tax=Rhizodiscina lignyota TaxID=1504668 RepID=A0A9P4M7M0_9PEZI|nr:hypothetical protein NA57DRAFT_77724 [Rhizodiscina lignyota]